MTKMMVFGEKYAGKKVKMVPKYSNRKQQYVWDFLMRGTCVLEGNDWKRGQNMGWSGHKVNIVWGNKLDNRSWDPLEFNTNCVWSGIMGI